MQPPPLRSVAKMLFHDLITLGLCCQTLRNVHKHPKSDFSGQSNCPSSSQWKDQEISAQPSGIPFVRGYEDSLFRCCPAGDGSEGSARPTDGWAGNI